MKKHILQENYEKIFGPVKEDWWDDMDEPSQAQYIKDHPGSKQAQQADKDSDGDEMTSFEPGMDFQGFQKAYADSPDGPEMKLGSAKDAWEKYQSGELSKPDSEPEGDYETGPGQGIDWKHPDDEEKPDDEPSDEEIIDYIEDQGYRDDFDHDGNPTPEAYKDAKEKLIAQNKEEPSDMDTERPSDEPEDEPSGELPDKVDSSQDASELQDKLDSIEDKYSEIGSKWDEKLGELSSIDVDEITDEQIEEMGEAGREMSRNYKASSISREMMSIDVSDEEGLEEFNDLLSNLNKQSSSPRTGNELNQETLTIDGKQYRRISELEKEPKSKYEFSEFYKRFKR